MMTLKKWKLRRYLMVYDMKHLTLTMILYFGFLLILLFPISIEENFSAWFGGYIGAPIVAIILTRNMLRSLRATNRHLASYKAVGKLEKILKDFATAEKAMGGNLYIGAMGLYGKGGKQIVLYSDIQKIYSIDADRHGQKPRDLMYVDKQGADRFICRLDPAGQSNTEIERLYRLVEKKNPAAKTGQ